MWLRVLALVLGVAAALTLLASGPGTRLGLWDWRTGLGLLRYAAYLGMAAAAVSLVGIFWSSVRRGGALVLGMALVLGVASFAAPLAFQAQARAFPPINDIRTDVENSAPALAKAQREAYPDIAPVVLPVPPRPAFARAEAAAEAMGWEIASRDPAAGTLRAVATSAWFGFEDDVTIRVSPHGSGSRIDIRSRSRVGRGDAGANAERIRAWRAALLK
jgi:uncharacterized protein (DUF1499 family)